MTVLHVVPSLSLKHGGPSVAVPAMADALIRRGIDVTIATTDDDGPTNRLAVLRGQTLEDEHGVRYIYFRKNTEFYKFSFHLMHWLFNHVGDFDLVHIHALFSHSSIAAGMIANYRGIPYVVRPLGVLNKWGMENRRRSLKRLSLRHIELPMLRRAAGIHYTSSAERREASAAHPDIGLLPSVVIPLPIETKLDEDSSRLARFHQRFTEVGDRPIVLFLSRIDPKKGIELLLSALMEIVKSVPDVLLVLAGAGDERYLAALRAKIEAKGLFNNVLWAGFLEGKEKAAAFRAATVYVLPSYSENFGIAAAEALAAGAPSILSDQVAISDDVASADAGIVVPCEPAAIAKAILSLLQDAELRKSLSKRARILVSERFSPEAVGKALHELYEFVLKADTRVQTVGA